MLRPTRSKWFLPSFCIALGLAFLATQWVGGSARDGIYALLFMAAVGLVVLLSGGRSETVRALRGDGTDERFRAIDVHAGALTGFVLITTLVVLALIELARGHDIDPYGQLLAVAGITYVVSLVFMHWRG